MLNIFSLINNSFSSCFLEGLVSVLDFFSCSRCTWSPSWRFIWATTDYHFFFQLNFVKSMKNLLHWSYTPCQIVFIIISSSSLYYVIYHLLMCTLEPARDFSSMQLHKLSKIYCSGKSFTEHATIFAQKNSENHLYS